MFIRNEQKIEKVFITNEQKSRKVFIENEYKTHISTYISIKQKQTFSKFCFL